MTISSAEGHTNQQQLQISAVTREAVPEEVKRSAEEQQKLESQNNKVRSNGKQGPQRTGHGDSVELSRESSKLAAGETSAHEAKETSKEEAGELKLFNNRGEIVQKNSGDSLVELFG